MVKCPYCKYSEGNFIKLKEMNAGDYLVEGTKGELYICEEKIFEESYEEVKT